MSRALWRFGFTILLLAATLIVARALEHRPPESMARPLETIGDNFDGWTGTSNPPLKGEVLEELLPTSYLSRTYRRGGDTVNLFIAYYAQQRAGETMHSPKNCLPGSGWEVWNYGLAEVPVYGRRITVNKYFVENGASRALVLYWYQSRRRIIARELVAKVLLVRDALWEGHTGGSIVRLTLPDVPRALEAGTAFASSIIPELQRCLGP